jgi:hypothetical protein
MCSGQVCGDCQEASASGATATCAKGRHRNIPAAIHGQASNSAGNNSVNSITEVTKIEIQPDPDCLRRDGITIQQLQYAIAASNANGVGDIIVQGHSALNVRGVGLMPGEGPVETMLGLEYLELDAYLASGAKPLPILWNRRSSAPLDRL